MDERRLRRGRRVQIARDDERAVGVGVGGGEGRQDRAPGVCVTERAPIRRVDCRPGRSRRPQANRWIRQSSAASVRTRRRAPAGGLQPAAPRRLGAACRSALGVWPLRPLWFFSVAAAAAAERNHRGHREHRAEQTEGRQQGDRQLHCATDRRAFRGADCQAMVWATAGAASRAAVRRRRWRMGRDGDAATWSASCRPEMRAAGPVARWATKPAEPGAHADLPCSVQVGASAGTTAARPGPPQGESP